MCICVHAWAHVSILALYVQNYANTCARLCQFVQNYANVCTSLCQFVQAYANICASLCQFVQNYVQAYANLCKLMCKLIVRIAYISHPKEELWRNWGGLLDGHMTCGWGRIT